MRYIDADELLKALQGRYESALSWYDNVSDSNLKIRSEQAVATFLECILTLKAQSTADVEEVRHGKWEHGHEVHREYIGDALLAICYDKWWCSQCHYTIDDHHYSKITYKRCPECGAHMDKEK